METQEAKSVPNKSRSKSKHIDCKRSDHWTDCIVLDAIEASIPIATTTAKQARSTRDLIPAGGTPAIQPCTEENNYDSHWDKTECRREYARGTPGQSACRGDPIIPTLQLQPQHLLMVVSLSLYKVLDNFALEALFDLLMPL